MQTNIILLNNTSDGEQCWPLRRRDIYYGQVALEKTPEVISDQQAKTAWQNNQPIYLPAILQSKLPTVAEQLQQSASLYQAVLDDADIADVLDESPYKQRLLPDFELLCSRYDAADEQEIVSVDFDCHENNQLFEDIWMRISWLSFVEGDASLRFRFSFGMEGYEDVSLDLTRQMLAAKLEERIFPESSLITENKALRETLGKIIESQKFQFLERIVYYNAPNGGAQFHHDAEKGHLGVVYAQLTRNTFWLALSKAELILEIQKFLTNESHISNFKELLTKHEECDAGIIQRFGDPDFLDEALNDLFHPELMILLNETKAFVSQLVANQYAYILQPGDVLLLPQESLANCAWHTVFCLGDKPGEALSFAIKQFD